MKQSEAVVSAVVNTCAPNDDGSFTPDATERKAIYEILIEGFMSKRIDYSKPLSLDAITKYVPGLLNNWLRKGKQLNGNVEYVAKHPGSRAGSGDKTLTAMKLLRDTQESAEAKADIQRAIDARIAEVAASKVKTINPDDLPAELREKYLAGK